MGKHGVTEQTGAAERPLRRVWATFASWHDDPDLYRDIYTRTVSAGVVGVIAYGIAAMSGFVSRRPLVVLTAVFFVVSLVWLVVTIAKVAPIWRQVRPLFRAWNDDTSPEALRAKDLYGSLFFSMLLTVASGLFLGRVSQ